MGFIGWVSFIIFYKYVNVFAVPVLAGIVRYLILYFWKYTGQKSPGHFRIFFSLATFFMAIVIILACKVFEFGDGKDSFVLISGIVTYFSVSYLYRYLVANNIGISNSHLT